MNGEACAGVSPIHRTMRNAGCETTLRPRVCFRSFLIENSLRAGPLVGGGPPGGVESVGPRPSNVGCRPSRFCPSNGPDHAPTPASQHEHHEGHHCRRFRVCGSRSGRVRRFGRHRERADVEHSGERRREVAWNGYWGSGATVKSRGPRPPALVDCWFRACRARQRRPEI
jgi:hypothetical protein